MEPLVSSKTPQPFTRRKGRSTAGCLLPSFVSAICFCLCLSFIFQPDFCNPSHPPTAGSSQASFDSDCMSLSTPHSQERSLIGLAWVSCSLLNPSTVARELGHCNRWSQSESFIWRGRKSINPKVGG